MLSVIRELAEEAEARAPGAAGARRAARRSSSGAARRRSRARPSSCRCCGTRASSTRAAPGLLELVRGVAAAVTRRADPRGAAASRSISRSRRSTRSSRATATARSSSSKARTLDREALEARARAARRLAARRRRRRRAIKVHVHTDDPGAALSIGTRSGTIDRIEIANMHEQTQQREERLLAAVPDAPRARSRRRRGRRGRRATGASSRASREAVGPLAIVEGGQTMNPSTADLLRAVQSLDAEEADHPPEQLEHRARRRARRRERRPPRRGRRTPTRSRRGLAAMVAFDGSRTAAENAAEMREARRRGRDGRGDDRLARRRR